MPQRVAARAQVFWLDSLPAVSLIPAIPEGARQSIPPTLLVLMFGTLFLMVVLSLGAVLK